MRLLLLAAALLLAGCATTDTYTNAQGVEVKCDRPGWPAWTASYWKYNQCMEGKPN